MGKQSRAKAQVKRFRRDRPDLLEKLQECKLFLQSSAAAFDQGYEAEAKRLAVTLRVLLYDTRQSHSLLTALGAKTRMQFVDTANPINPANLLNEPGLVIMCMEMTETGAKGSYVAPLKNLSPSRQGRTQAFADWWQNPVMKVDDKTTWSRKQLVLELANKEGGAHVDPEHNDAYEQLVRRNGLGWVAFSGDQASPFEGNVVAASVRQVTYEVVETLLASSALFA